MFDSTVIKEIVTITIKQYNLQF